MAPVDVKKLRISMIIPIITNYSSIGEAAWQYCGIKSAKIAPRIEIADRRTNNVFL